jgi:hypothetical protein
MKKGEGGGGFAMSCSAARTMSAGSGQRAEAAQLHAPVMPESAREYKWIPVLALAMWYAVSAGFRSRDERTRESSLRSRHL